MLIKPHRRLYTIRSVDAKKIINEGSLAWGSDPARALFGPLYFLVFTSVGEVK